MTPRISNTSVSQHETLQKLAIAMHYNLKAARRFELIIIITALHVMQTRYCDENSVCLSVTRVYCDKTVERSVQIYIPYERTFSLVF